ncbi:TlpA family protein disulfide reductase [Agromyces sp. Marseille-Q5079]|uniref:TlpA family protein disulfide reductase n=1 Tax=Agromyces sp. Marseille-Q5079 TaxID=3439059 RepID=UPI003D9C8D6D
MKKPFLPIVVLAVTGSLVLTGCASSDVADQYREGSGKNFIAGNGTITEIPVAERGEPVGFAGITETGKPIASTDFDGQPLVVNFWYAGCAPCRKEAPDLQALSEQFREAGVQFIGVNVRDQAATAKAFADTYSVTYPSIMDADQSEVLLAFSGIVAPNAVPTTLVLDAEHRVAARVLGRVTSRSILETLIESVVPEQQ